MQMLMSGCEMPQRRQSSSYFECWLLRIVFTWTCSAASWRLYELLHPLCLGFLCKKKKKLLYIKRNWNSWQIKFLAAGMLSLNVYLFSSKACHMLWYVLAAFFFVFFVFFGLDIGMYCLLFWGREVRLPTTNCCASSVLGIKIKDLLTGPSNACG